MKSSYLNALTFKLQELKTKYSFSLIFKDIYFMNSNPIYGKNHSKLQYKINVQYQVFALWSVDAVDTVCDALTFIK